MCSGSFQEWTIPSVGILFEGKAKVVKNSGDSYWDNGKENGNYRDYRDYIRSI